MVRQVMYISISGEHRIAVFNVDATSGILDPRGSVALPGQPGPLAMSRDGRRLYAAIRNLASAAMLRVAQDGDLSLEQVQPIGGSAPYITLDAAGRWLLGACYGEGIVLTQALDADGRFEAAPPRIVPTAKNAHCIVLSADNRFAYVPHTGPNAIHQFAFDADTGGLTPLDPPRVAGPPGAGPRHLVLHPALDLAYVVHEMIAGVTVYRADRRGGGLSPVRTISAVPADFTAPNTGADIHLTPNGRWLYSSNRGHDSLTVFRVVQGTGLPEPVGYAATEPTPRAFTIDPGGRFVYVAGQASGRIAMYRIDQTTGQLVPLGAVDAGKTPLWVTIHSPPGGSR